MRISPYAGLLTLMGCSLIATGARAGTEEFPAGTKQFATGSNQFADGLTEDFAWVTTANGGVFNVSRPVGDPSEQLALVNPDEGSYNVTETINGGKGAKTTAMVVNGDFDTFTFTQAVKIAYTFATPMMINGTLVSNLLTASFAAGTMFNINTITGNASWTFSKSGGQGLVFTSDLEKFSALGDESGAFSFSTVNNTVGETPFGGFSAYGSSNYAATVPPSVPEPLSIGMLLVGMVGVSFASYRSKSSNSRSIIS